MSKSSERKTLICPVCNHDVTTNAPDQLLTKINSALATIRQEERRGAIAALTSLPARGTMNYRRGYEEGVRDAIRTLEAAANETKKEDNGDRN